ncbi:MAG: GNAT family N-acetyltransferase [Bacteroidales bacterium]|nr:GNAT family N-acetyltransferase [Bacteroidales bacterium]
MAENNYHVRNFSNKDLTELEFLWEETGMGEDERGDNLEVILRTIEAGGKLLVLIVDEKLVGSSWMTQDGRRMYLHHFSILPDYQGLGLSHMLMNTSLEWMREIGLQIKLEVHESNNIARDLYVKYGFHKLDGYWVYIIREL